MQQALPNNQDIQQSLEFMCTLQNIHLNHLLDQVIAADPNTSSNKNYYRDLQIGYVLVFPFIVLLF